MLHAGLDLSRRKIDVCLLSGAGELVDEWVSPPDADGLRGLAARAAMWGPAVRGVIESMNGARFVHARLEEHGWEVLIADATKVKGLAPLACKTDKIDARVLATYYAERYQHTKRRLGRQRGPKVAQIELARKLTEAIWHMLTRNQPFAPAGAPFRLAA